MFLRSGEIHVGIKKGFLKDIQLNPEFRRPLIDVLKPWRMKTYVDILVVVEENISINPVNDFGIAAVIDLIRNSAVGRIRFCVDIALRNGDALSVDLSNIVAITAVSSP